MKRTLTVSALWRTVGNMFRSRTVIVPQMRLSGRWLESAGFTEGARVQVLVEQGQLTITLAQ